MENTTKLELTMLDGVMSYQQYTYFLEFYALVASVMSTFGFITNILNIRTFLSMGLLDGITVSFLFLAVADLAFVLARLGRSVATGFLLLESKSNYTVTFPVDPYSIYLYIANVGHLVYTYTVLITTFLAVARCMCVTKPLHFKHAFTRKRSVIVLVTFLVFSVASYIPIFMYMGIVDQFDPRINATRPRLWISPKRELVKDVIWGIRDVFITLAAQVIVIICIIVMAKSLREAAKFRQQSSSGLSVSSGEESRNNQQPNSSLDDINQNPTKLSGKELRVVQQVIIISAVYIICNTPKITVTIAGIVVPDLTIGRRYQMMYTSMICLADVFQIFNSSINVFIYYKYNSRFKSLFGSTTCSCC